jgi:hypothetical protein
MMTGLRIVISSIFCLRMIFSEDRYPLSGPCAKGDRTAIDSLRRLKCDVAEAPNPQDGPV